MEHTFIQKEYIPVPTLVLFCNIVWGWGGDTQIAAQKITMVVLKYYLVIFISLIRMRSKRDIKMGRLCTPGGAVLGIVGGGARFRFLNGEAIFEEYMLFWVRLYALVVVLKILLDFSL